MRPPMRSHVLHVLDCTGVGLRVKPTYRMSTSQHAREMMGESGTHRFFVLQHQGQTPRPGPILCRNREPGKCSPEPAHWQAPTSNVAYAQQYSLYRFKSSTVSQPHDRRFSDGSKLPVSHRPPAVYSCSDSESDRDRKLKMRGVMQQDEEHVRFAKDFPKVWINLWAWDGVIMVRRVLCGSWYQQARTVRRSEGRTMRVCKS